MRGLIWIILLTVSLAAGVAGANPLPWTQIGLYGDPAATVNVVHDVGPATLEVYVVQTTYFDPGVMAVRFSAPPSPGFEAVHLSEVCNFDLMGDSQTGAQVFYPGCFSGTVHVMTITYHVEGLSQHCHLYEPQPYPGASSIESQACGEVGWSWTDGVGVYVSTDPEESCGSPVEQSTWGGIKAMYR